MRAIGRSLPKWLRSPSNVDRYPVCDLYPRATTRAARSAQVYLSLHLQRGDHCTWLKSYLGYSITEPTPDHSLLTIIRQRLPLAIHEQTLPQTLAMAQANLLWAGSDVDIKDVPADKGYHSNETVTWCSSFGIRTNIPERESRWCRRWTGKSGEEKSAVHKSRRRVRGKRGKQLGRLRSEYTERSFAHVC